MKGVISVTGEQAWNIVILKLDFSSEELQTSTGLWFKAYTTDEYLFVDKSDNNDPSCNITKARKISKKDFITIYPYHKEWFNQDVNARQVIRDKSRNTAYIFALVDKYICNKDSETVYDPDVPALLMLILSTFGALGGIAGTLAHIDYRRGKRKTDLHNLRVREQIEHEIEVSFAEIRYTVRNIERRIDGIMELIKTSYNYDGKPPYDESLCLRMEFGGKPLLLSQMGFTRFRWLQDDIISDISKFLRNISIIEQVLSEYSSWFSERLHLERIKYDLHKVVDECNKLLLNVREYAIDEFMRKLQELCNQIEQISRWFLDEK